MRNNKGITLVALVITIIVLLILAGVSIAALGGQNGILTNASKARQEDAIGAQRDVVAMAINEATNAYYAVTYAGADESNYQYTSGAGTGTKVGTDAQTTAINFIKDATKVSSDEATSKGEGAKVVITGSKVQIITTDDDPVFIEATLTNGGLSTWSATAEYTE